MEIIDSLVTGDVIITADIQYNNMLAENVTVEEYVTTRIYGTIKKDVTVNAGSTLYLHGKYHGKLTNNGGTIHIY
ncbi:MAG: hypothetical protein K0S53_3290 [Bacteroidetes bacterium]|jgi:hypothetical protein|nr:hypothetical protein [Bacteroidota bacterium]